VHQAGKSIAVSPFVFCLNFKYSLCTQWALSSFSGSLPIELRHIVLLSVVLISDTRLDYDHACVTYWEQWLAYRGRARWRRPL